MDYVVGVVYTVRSNDTRKGDVERVTQVDVTADSPDDAKAKALSEVTNSVRISFIRTVEGGL